MLQYDTSRQLTEDHREGHRAMAEAEQLARLLHAARRPRRVTHRRREDGPRPLILNVWPRR